MASRVDKVIEVHKLANQLLREHGLYEQGWDFKLLNSKRQVGNCNHITKEIGFSIHFIHRTGMDEIKDTLLHEIAHALAGPREGHGRVWKDWCIAVGAKPERLAGEETVSTAKPNYILECPSCGRRWQRYRLKRGIYGAKCPDCKQVVTIYRVRKGA
jgi:predicted SprT family Zn-dependent metalloprotease